ncbi:MAG TPA: DUF1570 domain-containing protein [Planctomycetota bacterium]|nr:DUF1570 domain-containing protein [Planctomycetota bacterium]
MNDGSKMEGTIVEETNDGIVLKIKFGTTSYKKSEIKEIIRSGGAVTKDAAELRDVLKLKNGDEHRGLLVSEDNKEIVFDLVMSGKNVSKIMLSRTTFSKDEVADLKKITDQERSAARTYIATAEDQARKDSILEKEVVLEEVMLPALKDANKQVRGKKIELEHFTIISNAGDDFLKRAAFRLNKVFNAYKQYFGVDRNTGKKVTVLIYGSMANYYADAGQGIKNPAFYAPDHKLICAGVDIAKYEAQIAQIRAHHKDLTSQLTEWKIKVNNARSQVQQAVSRARDQINAGGKGTTAAGQAAMDRISQQQRDWQVQIGQHEKVVNDLQAQIEALNRRNDIVFNEYTQAMFATLYHEGFHAFLDNFLMPEGLSRQVPRWLNEGLAQYFEVSRIEADRLILGQDSRERLALLRKFKNENALIPLDKFATAGQSDYIVHEISNLENSTKNYLQAWLVTNIIGEKGRLKKEVLQEYAKLLEAKKPPLEALSTLAGMSTAELQAAIDEKLKPSFQK